MKKLIFNNFINQVSYYQHYTHNVKVKYFSNVQLVNSGQANDTFNIISGYFDADSLNNVTAYCKKNTLNVGLWIAAEESSMLSDILLESYIKDETCNIMHLELFKINVSKTNLRFTICDNTSSFNDFINVFVSVFDVDERSDIKNFYSSLSSKILASRKMKFCVGYINNAPAAIGCIYTHNSDMSYIYSLIVTPAMQKQGYGRAMMEHLLNYINAANIKSCSLYSSTQGRNLYQNLGFSSIGDIEVYKLKTCM